MKRSRSAGPGGAAHTRPQKVINVHNTMLGHFAPRPGPTAGPGGGGQRPPQLFPMLETKILAPEKNPDFKRDTYIRVQSKRSGVLFGECATCTRPSRPISDFARPISNNTHRDRAAFFDAVSDYTAAYAARDLEAATAARGRVNETRRAFCPPCTENAAKLSPAVQACKDEWIQMRKDACKRHDGCMNEGCPWKGVAHRDWRVLQADHLDPKGIDDIANTKVHMVSDYTWWSGNGGVAAMHLEASKCQWICGFCHSLEPTSDSGRRCGDPANMPDGKSSGTVEEVKQYKAKHHATIRYPKQQYVDAEKLRIGGCAQCKRGVTLETCVAFQFDHVDETTKMKGEDTLAGKQGGVGGLVNRSAKRAALDEIKDVLDAEMAKCQLLCANCHKLKTWDGEAVEEGEEA